MDTMERVTGIGGVFFKAKDPERAEEWYRTHLGVEANDMHAVFPWRHADDPEKRGATVWATFAADTDYFGSGGGDFMINYRVANLDRMLAQLREAGVEVDEKVEDYAYGRFGWATDPDGNRIELWEPAEGY